MPKKTIRPPMEFTIRRYNRHQFFVERLKQLGLFDQDSDYNGMIGQAVKDLSALFMKQGHSGESAKSTLGVFNMLMEEWTSKPLGGITSQKKVK